MGGPIGRLVRLAGLLLRYAGMILRGETGSAARPAVGSIAPGFAVRSHEGKIVSLDQYTGRSQLVLFFFPRADTPG